MDSIKGLIIAAILIAVVIVGGIFLYARPKETGKNANPTTVQTTQQQAPAVTQAVQTITLSKTGFSPVNLTVKAGTRVKWINNSGGLATVDSNPHPTHTSYPPMNFGAFSNGSSVELVFIKAGTYGYHNHLNPSQTGTIVVQ